MIGIKVNGEMADLYPGTQIQRERNNPFFLVKTSSGKDGIPGEYSFPFTMPPTDKNVRLYKFPEHLPSVKQKVFDSIVYNEGMQLSYGKQIIDNIDGHLAKANVGKIDTHFYSNSSEFFQRVKTVKLRDLALGGPRVFQWAGYSRTAPGFWKHIHDTWLYDNSDNGDYVFAPVYNPGFTGTAEYMNLTKWQANDAEIDKDACVVSLCPQIYVKFVLKKIFSENGYTLTGDLLNDFDFKKLVMQSFYGVYWSEVVFSDDEEPKLIPTPVDNITINLQEHMDKDVTCSEFIVELMKLLPIGFDINDNARTAKIVWLHKLSPAGAKNRTSSVRPGFNISLGDNESSNIILGIKRNVHSSDSWAAQTTDLSKFKYKGVSEGIPYGLYPLNDAYLVLWYNGYFAMLRDLHVADTTQFIGNNNNNYEPAGATEFIESNISFMPLEGIYDTDFYKDKPGIHRPKIYYMPACSVEGFWHGKTDDLKNWGLRVMFYRGKKNFMTDNADVANPWLTSSAYTFKKVGAASQPLKDGTWSLSLTDEATGLLQFWKKWLVILGNNEILKGTLNLPLHEYLQLRWNDVLLIDNTPYIISKINEILPYAGSVDFEAVRMIY